MFSDLAIPFLGLRSFQLCNGEMGRKAHRIYSTALGKGACCKLLPEFNKVFKTPHEN
jgi:hypothetical protein